MSTGEIVQLGFSEGINTGAPTQTLLTALNLKVFATDAAFLAYVARAAQDGDIYKNSTDGFIHYHDGNSWQIITSMLHGWVNPEGNLGIVFNASPAGITITPTAIQDYYISGVKRSIGAGVSKTANIVEAEGVWFFYIDLLGNLGSSQSDSVTHDATKCYVASGYWDDTNNAWVISADEYHTHRFPLFVKSYLHKYLKTRYNDGLTPGDFTISTGASDSHAQFSVSNGHVQDEDLEHTINTQAVPASMPILYRSGASGAWRVDALTNFAFKTTGTGRAAYNQFTGGSWQQTEVPNGDYVLVHGFGSNDKRQKPIIIQGQNSYSNINNARVGAVTEISSLITSGLPLEERVPLWTIIVQTSNAYGNSVKSRIVTNDLGTDYIDWRNQAINPGTGPSDHGSLSGLGDDDHSQYWNVLGRSTETIIYLGPSTVDGSFRINCSGTVPVVEKRVAGVWTIFSYTIVQNTIANINAATRKEGIIWYSTDENKYYGDDGSGLIALGGGGGGPQVVFRNDGLDTWEEVSIANQLAYLAESGSAKKLYGIIKVPSTYSAGDAISLKIDIMGSVGSGNILVQSVSTLINAASANISSTTNQHSSVNTAQTISAIEKPYQITIDITDGNGQINGVNPVPGDNIVFYFTRGSDTCTGNCYLLPSTLEPVIG